MPVPAMAEPVVDHQKRFQAAVDVIQNLPKNGSYRPSYEMMLRFYGLYKQAVCGPCALPRPSFWDLVGRYKWSVRKSSDSSEIPKRDVKAYTRDAWSSLGEMSKESAMAEYVHEMKKVAQEVIDTMPMNENTAALFHHFEPLYQVIDDMPRPPESLLKLREGLKGSEHADRPVEMEDKVEEQGAPTEDLRANSDHDLSLSEAMDPTANTVPNDSGVSEGLVLTSDSENEIFCDSLDTVEQLGSVKPPPVSSNGFHNGHAPESSPCEIPPLDSHQKFRQVGAGQGGEGAEDGKGHGPSRRGRDAGRGGSYHNWRDRGVPQGSPRRGASGGGGGAGRGGGDGSEGGVERLHDAQLQQQIVVALRRLREDMRSVMERLEVVERLAATHSQASDWRPCLQCAASASQQQEESWWPFDVSGQTVLLFLLWPFVAQGLVYLLRKAHKRSRMLS